MEDKRKGGNESWEVKLGHGGVLAIWGRKRRCASQGCVQGREVTGGSGHDLIGTEYPLEVLVAMETRQMGEPAQGGRDKGAVGTDVQGEPETSIHVKVAE